MLINRRLFVSCFQCHVANANSKQTNMIRRPIRFRWRLGGLWQQQRRQTKYALEVWFVDFLSDEFKNDVWVGALPVQPESCPLGGLLRGQNLQDPPTAVKICRYEFTEKNPNVYPENW
jgi:hypothetical protein